MFVAARRTNDYGAERRIVECPKCHCTISYDKDDVDYFADGNGLFCPDCNEQIYLEKYGEYQFPEVFRHLSNASLSKEQIQKNIDQVVSLLSQDLIGSSYWREDDGILVIGKKYQDGNSIVVCKDYYLLS